MSAVQRVSVGENESRESKKGPHEQLVAVLFRQTVIGQHMSPIVATKKIIGRNIACLSTNSLVKKKKSILHLCYSIT